MSTDVEEDEGAKMFSKEITKKPIRIRTKTKIS